MIYEPAEDSYLIEKYVKKYARGRSVLDIGTGSGILARAGLNSGASLVLAVDIDKKVVRSLKGEKFEVRESNLFSKVKEKFDLIVFNPPYLPNDKREDSESARITSGGKKGDEIIVRFLKDVNRYLNRDAKILLLVSSLTPLARIKKVLKEKKFVYEVLGSEKVFMERLEVWEIKKRKS